MLPFITTEKEIQLKQRLLYRFSKVDAKYVQKHASSRQKVVIALAADYGNLGDVAITLAQRDLLKQKFPQRDILLFTISDTFTGLKSLKKVINEKDLITLVGGGNTGDLYPEIEFARQFIVKQFPHNTLISFPQTVDYQNVEKIKADLKVYANHQKLQLTVREQRSQTFYQQHFTKGAQLLPDIVLTLGETFGDSEVQRREILLCLRQDKEVGVGLNAAVLPDLAEKDHLVYQDTQLAVDRLPLAKGMLQVQQLLKQFQQKQLVITDRLHGMIFACITGTPCIALDNKNKKVSGVYQAWLQGKTNIHVFQDPPTHSEFLAKVDELYGQTYAPPKLKKYFEDLLHLEKKKKSI